MRWYRLKIGNEIYEGGKSSLLKNLVSSSASLNISFNISIFENNATSILGTLQIYNASLQWYLQTQSKKGLDIELYAGFSENSPFVTKMNYSKDFNNLLLKGEVQNIIGDFSGIQSVVTIYFIPYAKDTTTALDLKLVISDNDKPAQKVMDYLNNNKALSENGRLAIKFYASDEAKKQIYNGSDTQIKGDSLASFLESFRKMPMKNYNFKYIFTNHKECKIHGGLSEFSGATYAINSNDFIKQPETIDFAGSLQCILKLSPSYKVGDKIKIKGVLPSLQSVSTSIKTLSPTQDTTKLFFTGEYQITSINHIGEFYNVAPDSWTTQLVCVPQKPILQTKT